MVWKIFKLILGKYAVWVVVLFLSVYIFILKSGYSKQITGLWSLIDNSKSTLEQTKDYAARLSASLEDSEQLNSVLVNKINFLSDSLNTEWSLKLKRLEQIVKDKNLKIKGNTYLVAEYESLSDSLKKVIQEQDGERVRISFEQKFNTVVVKGYTLSDPPFAYVAVDRLPLALNVLVTEVSKDKHKVFITTSDPGFSISQLETKYLGFKETGLWSKLRKVPKASLGVFGGEQYAQFGLRINRFEPQIQMGTKGVQGGIEFHFLK